MELLLTSPQTLSFRPSSVPNAKLTEVLAFPVNDAIVIKYLKDCGVNVTPVVLYEVFLKRPCLWLGFENCADVLPSYQGYLGIRYLNSYVGRMGPTTSGEELLKHHDIRFRLDLSPLAEEDDPSSTKWKPSIASYDFKMNPTTTGLVSESDVCIDFQSPAANLIRWMDTSSKWQIVVSLSMIVTRKPDFITSPGYGRFGVFPTQDQDDLTLVAKNRAEFKCNRSILAYKSPYFHRVFQLQNANLSFPILRLEKMSEITVQAFLDYLYHWKTSEAQENSVVCVDLLDAAVTFEIVPMEMCMEVILLSKPDDWYSPEAALRLMLHAKDTEKKNLKSKAKGLLKLMFTEIEMLPEYNKLLTNEPKEVNKLIKWLAIS